MATGLSSKMAGLHVTGSKVNVPDNYRALLMYYLKIVTACIDIDDVDDRVLDQLRNFKDFKINLKLVSELVNLCFKYSPRGLKEKVFFNNVAMCKDSDNNLYAYNERKGLNASAKVQLYDDKYTVKKINHGV